MNVAISKSWKTILSKEFEKSYFSQLTSFVRSEYMSHTCYPKGNEIFAAFDHCSFEDVKVASPDHVSDLKTLPYQPARASFNYNIGFCNHCYMVKNDVEFRNNWTFDNINQNSSFEEIIDDWMKDNQFKRVVYKHGRVRYPKYNV